MTGAKIIDVESSIQGIKNAVTDKTVAFVLFPSPLYERGLPKCEEVIPFLKRLGVPVIVDASAQLPPKSNLCYYTKVLGADACIFSGGKHIRGPQSTGLIVGERQVMKLCRDLSSPNERLGRGFKTGKEELAGFLTALEDFVSIPQEIVYQEQEAKLKRMQDIIVSQNRKVDTEMRREGRLGTYQPLLLVWLPDGMSAFDCNRFTRSLPEPIDIGTYSREFCMPENLIFLNAYNLKDMEEAEKVANAVCEFMVVNKM